jgi:hypothetical protein
VHTVAHAIAVGAPRLRDACRGALPAPLELPDFPSRELDAARKQQGDAGREGRRSRDGRSAQLRRGKRAAHHVRRHTAHRPRREVARGGERRQAVEAGPDRGGQGAAVLAIEPPSRIACTARLAINPMRGSPLSSPYQEPSRSAVPTVKETCAYCFDSKRSGQNAGAEVTTR